MEYENYIWDLGGTLLDNYESSSSAFEATLWQMAKRRISHQEIYHALKISTDYAIEKFASDIPNFLKKYKALEAETLKHPILFENAKDILAKVKASDGKNFMISHRNNQVLDILKAAQIEQYFTEVVTSDNGFPRKPSPESIFYLIDKYHLNIQKTVMIGDRPIDIQAGQAAQIDTIFFDAEKSLTQVTRNIQSLAELL